MNSAQDIVSFIEANQEKLYRVAFSYVKNREDALDIVHDAIVKALQKQHTLRESRFLQTWFYRILINESLSHLRWERRGPVLEELDSAALPAAGDPSRSDYIDLYDALDKLPPKLRTVVILRFFEEMTLEEIAAVTSTNLSTTKSRLYRALAILKVDMEVPEND